jgi:hypothetical protein
MHLTIGMATYDDHAGVWMTIQSLRMHNYCHDVEFLVVDNNPSGKHADEVRKLCGQVSGHDNEGCRYVPYDEIVGNAAAKNHVFAKARGDWCLVVDSHILMRAGVVARLLRHCRQHADSLDLFQGPCLTGGQFTPQSSWTDGWGGGMWGKWNSDKRAANPEADPFEIDGMGGGLLLCRRDAWLGFHPAMRGFGGESVYIQRKYIKRGRKVWCLPWLQWLHRYGRPGGVPFPMRTREICRNLMLGQIELGLDLAPMRAHYAERGMGDAEWDAILDEAMGLH